MLMGESKRRTDENSDPEQIDSELSFDNGYSLETPQEMNDARNMLDYRREEVRNISWTMRMPGLLMTA